MMRATGAYKNDVKNFIQAVIPNKVKELTQENEDDISKSFKTALYVKCENEAYSKRLRESEVKVITDYKLALGRRKIPDFKPVSDVLDKIDWFHQFAYTER